MIQPIKDLFYVKANEMANKTINVGGINMYMDIDFDRYIHAVREAEVVKAPKKIDTKYINDFKIEEGDKVHVHHFVVQPEEKENIDGEDYFRCLYSQIYAVEKPDGNIKVPEKWCFVSPIMEDESSIKTTSGIFLKPNVEEVPQIGKVEFCSDYCKSQGLKEGDIVYYGKDCNYDMNIRGQKVYRINYLHIAGIVS